MNILVITPYTSFGESLRLSLEERGDFLIELPQTGQEALANAKKLSYELIILDAAVDDQPFKELGQKLKTNHPEAKFIIIPPNNNPDDPDVFDLKPDAVINKPFYLPDFLSTLERLFNISLADQKPKSPQQKKHTFKFKTEHPSIELYPWLLSEHLTRDYLTYLLSSTPVTASMVLTKNQIYAAAGKWVKISPEQVKDIVLSNWTNSDGFDLAKFITISETGETALIYVSILSKGYLLATLFTPKTTISTAHAKTNLIIHGLKTNPPQTILEVHADLELEAFSRQDEDGLEATLQSISKKNAEETILAEEEFHKSLLDDEEESIILATDKELEALFDTSPDEILFEEEEEDEEEQINLIRLLENMPPPDPSAQPAPEKLEWISEEPPQKTTQPVEDVEDKIDEPILPWEEESLDLPTAEFDVEETTIEDSSEPVVDLPTSLKREFSTSEFEEPLPRETKALEEDFSFPFESETSVEEAELSGSDFEIGEVDEFLDAIPISPIVTNLPENGHLETDEKRSGIAADEVSAEKITESSREEPESTFFHEEPVDETADHLETSLLEVKSADRLPTSILDKEAAPSLDEDISADKDVEIRFPWDKEIIEETTEPTLVIETAQKPVPEKQPAFIQQEETTTPFSEMDLELPWEKSTPKEDEPQIGSDVDVDLDAWLSRLEQETDSPPSSKDYLEETQPIQVKKSETQEEEIVIPEPEPIVPFEITDAESELPEPAAEIEEPAIVQAAEALETDDQTFEDFLKELEIDEALIDGDTSAPEISSEIVEHELDMLFKDFNQETEDSATISEIQKPESTLPDNFLEAMENAEVALMMDEQVEELDRHNTELSTEDQDTQYKPLNLANTQPLRPLEQVKRSRKPAQSIDLPPLPVFEDQPSEEAMPKTSLLAYSCIMVPRVKGPVLINEVADSLNEWLPDIFNQQGWTLKNFSVNPEYIRWIISAAAEISPKDLVKKISDETTMRFREYFPEKSDLLSDGELWAAEYLILSSSHPPYSKLVKDFINKIHKTP